MPLIELNIASEGWPSFDVLEKLSGRAIDAAQKAARLTYPSEAELSLLFDDDNAVRKLNKRFRNIDKSTNVLSFPGENIDVGESAGVFLGDIAFGLETIQREAKLEEKIFEHHLSHLMIHGFLHLFGYDHNNDKEATIMETMEITALATLGIENPYGIAVAVDR